MPSRVTVRSKLTSVSSKPIGPGMIHPLSALDHAMSLHTLHIIFYFNNNPFGSFELDPSRESLSQVLSMYPTITGRLARGKDGNWEVRCNDAGVRVIKAKVDTTLDQWLRSADGSEERDLTAWDDGMPHDPNTWPPFRIQINNFEGGGVAIGLSWSHMLADLTSVASFFKSWTLAHRHFPITQPPLLSPTPLPALLLPNTRNNTNSATTYYYANKSSTPSPQNDSPKMATASFNFSTSIIKQCLSEVHDICPNATPFDFLSALFWTCIARLKPPKNDQTHSLSICIDLRNILKPPLPSGYFGNALHFSLLSMKAREIDGKKLGEVVGLVHRHLEGLEEEEICSAIEWLESQKEINGGKYRAPVCMYGPELTCINMEHLGLMEQSSLYDAVFSDNEKAAHVSCHVGNVVGEGLIMVMPCSDGGLARMVTVMLPEEQLHQLCDDHAILQLEPRMMLAGTPLSR